MLQNILVGLVAGVAAALLFVAPFSGSPLAIPLVAVTGLPIAIAGFGWGNLAALAAVASGATVTFALTAFSGETDLSPSATPNGAAYFALLTALPVAWATIAATQPTTTADGRGWRPFGRVLAHAAGALAIGVVVFGAVIGFDPVRLAARYTSILTEWAQSATTGATPPSGEDIALLADLFVALTPPAVALVSMLMVAVDLYLGAKLVRLSDRLNRPTESLWTIDLPATIPAAFVVALVLSFAPGAIGYAALAVAGALGGAVALEGLAVIHALSRGLTWRGPLLGAVYALAIVMGGLLVILFALLGLAESAFHLRARWPRLRGPSPK